jgi:transposase
MKALIGDYRREHLFTLKQCWLPGGTTQKLITECDQEIEQQVQTFDDKIDTRGNAAAGTEGKTQEAVRQRTAFRFARHLYRIFGVDLTAIPGMNILTAHTLLAEVGPDLSRFRSASAFASWLGLCPDNDISGGKKLSVKTRHVNNRPAVALRMAANGLYKSHSWLGDCYRRMRAKLDSPKAITAAAHKLARIVFHMLKIRQEYDETIFAKLEQKARTRTETKLKAQAKALGFQLVPAPPTA